MPKRKRTTENLDTVQNAHRVFMEAVESVETVDLTIVQQVMRDMALKAEGSAANADGNHDGRTAPPKRQKSGQSEMV